MSTFVQLQRCLGLRMPSLTADGKTSDQNVVLIACEIDVLLHPRDVGVPEHSAVYAMSVSLVRASRGGCRRTEVIEEKSDAAIRPQDCQCLRLQGRWKIWGDTRMKKSIFRRSCPIMSVEPPLHE